jgi:hypothetical protein
MVAGQLFIPILSKVMPVVNGVTIVIKRLLVNLASLMGVKIDFESFGQSGYKDTSVKSILLPPPPPLEPLLELVSSCNLFISSNPISDNVAFFAESATSW